ncbi:hypothetical protein GCM10023209_27720 [Roseibacterium beibuensis]|uniref:Uncharacterized protein n=1 Tax=[Roseibacterium] beibuensis TaxID=1193142 RepID=A0ABP9LG87_9RHOB
MDAVEQPGFAQLGQIAADGLHRDIELGGEIIDADPPDFAGYAQDIVLAGCDRHGFDLYRKQTRLKIDKTNME